ncbi:MAG: 3-hydroxybutyryl-CoA dehydrogenase [Deltaproteobacteria bacterium]|nr:3-hydroxybutyryl-CoA dehydrogenase [Deltaproteobacteria bacterium]
MTIATIGVTGAGQMGAGIAQVFAQAGLRVVLHDVAPAALERAVTGIGKSLAKLKEKGKLPEEPAAILARLTTTTQLGDFAAADFVVEAVPEQVALKMQLFSELDRVLRAGVTIASNTSSIAISALAAATQRPANVIGMHFMNPVPLMPCVEVIRSAATGDAAFTAVQTLVQRVGKTMVVSRDRPGFIVNRILMPMINEAAYALQEALATREDIDTAMKLSCNFPMGPLTLADFIGLDTVVAILNVMHDGLKDPKYVPCPLLNEYVAKGWTGKKAGRGFYPYS